MPVGKGRGVCYRRSGVPVMRQSRSSIRRELIRLRIGGASIYFIHFINVAEIRGRGDNMTHIETARFNEVIGLQIGAIQETAHTLNADSDLEELEANIAELEISIADLKATLAGIPHEHP